MPLHPGGLGSRINHVVEEYALAEALNHAFAVARCWMGWKRTRARTEVDVMDRMERGRGKAGWLKGTVHVGTLFFLGGQVGGCSDRHLDWAPYHLVHGLGLQSWYNSLLL